ncbi:MAG: glycosyltransferase [Lachnospiraceae bacterium]|nr:glycosyltransferase [Lachnospiraceae bacterium]
MPERKDRISLIIPVYNVERYLRKCLDSAVTQDYDNYEIIVVDDGSKDGSYGICGEYAERYDNVTLLHKENEGLMATWLKGLEYSTGEYIAFLDSDDWVEPDYLSRLASGIEKNADVTCCNRVMEYEDYQIFEKEPLTAGLYNYEKIKNNVFPVLLNNGTYLGRGVTPNRWGKLFKKDILLGNIQYCDKRISFGEDLNIVFPVLLDCKTLLILNDKKGLYHYRQNRQSIVRNYKRGMFHEICRLRRKLNEVNQKKRVYDFSEQIRRDFVCLFLEWIKNEARGEKAYSTLAKEISRAYQREKKRLEKAKEMNIAFRSFDKMLLECLRHGNRMGIGIWIFLYRNVKQKGLSADWKYFFRKKRHCKKIRVLMAGPHKSVKGGIRTVVDHYLSWGKWDRIKLYYVPTFIEKNNVIKVLFYGCHFMEIFFLCMFKKIDVVHLHVSERGSFYRKAFIIDFCRKLKIKTVLHHHGAEFMGFYDSSNQKRKKGIERILAAADVNIVLSEYQKREMEKKFPDAQLVVLYNAVAGNEENSYNAKAVNILFVGRLGQRKGIFDLLDAVEKADQTLDRKIVLDICGDGEVEKVRRKIEEKRLWHRVSHLGWCPKKELEEHYRKAMLYILPSYHEGLPMSLLEAMSHGVPCIASRVAAIPEVIKEGYNGLLVEPGNIEEIRKAIEQLVEAPRLRKELGKRGYESIQKRFLLSGGMNSLKKIYYRLENGK